jgi:hypothetical protein
MALDESRVRGPLLSEALRQEKQPFVCRLHPGDVFHDETVCPACRILAGNRRLERGKVTRYRRKKIELEDEHGKR